MGVTLTLFQSTGTSAFAMLSTKISLSGDAMAGATLGVLGLNGLHMALGTTGFF